jgi:hypothetical protein
MVAVDKAIDDGAKLRGAAKDADYQAPSLSSSIYWENPQSYSTPGAPPNGSDYVQLRSTAGNPLAARDVQSIEFSGPAKHAAAPMEWQSVLQAGDAVLAAGAAHDIDRSIVRPVAVPATGNRTLTFETKYETETDWDFAFVQVSTDDGLSWQSLANANTTSEHAPAALSSIIAELPGLNGTADWHTESFDLSAYAGTTVLLRFRMMTDAGTLGNGGEAGWWVDDVTVGGTLVSDGTLAGWGTEAPPIVGYTVQLVAFDSKNGKQTIVARVPLANGRTASLSGGALRSLIGNQAATVAAIVMYDEPSETISKYAPYTLKVNGVVQPGGGA